MCECFVDMRCGYPLPRRLVIMGLTSEINVNTTGGGPNTDAILANLAGKFLAHFRDRFWAIGTTVAPRTCHFREAERVSKAQRREGSVRGARKSVSGCCRAPSGPRTGGRRRSAAT